MRSKGGPAFQAVAASEHGDTNSLKQSKRQFYTPTATRAPILVALLCSILACIALLQVAVSNSVNEHTHSPTSSVLSKRQLFSSVTTYSDLTGTSAGITQTVLDTTYTASSTTITYIGSTYLHPGTALTVSALTYTFYFLSTTISGALTTVPVSLATVTGSAPLVTQISDGAPVAYLDTATPSSAWTTITRTLTIPMPTTTAYLDTATPSAAPVAASVTAPGADQSTTTSTGQSSTSSTDSAAYLDTSTPDTFSSSMALSSTLSDTLQTAYLDTSTPSVTPTASTSAAVPSDGGHLDTATPPGASSTTRDAFVTISTSQLNSAADTTYLATSVPSTTTPSITPSMPPESIFPSAATLTTSSITSLASQSATQPNTDIAASSLPVWETIVETETLTAYTAASSASTSSTSTVTSSSNAVVDSTGLVDTTALPETERVVTGKFSIHRYYAATYLCPLVVVILKSTWSTIFGSIKMTEPFYQLTRPGGADAQLSLLADYLSSGFSLTALSSLLHHQLLMLSAIAALSTTTILAPIASEAMSIKPSQMCPKDDGSARRCAPIWLLNIPCIRLLQALLSLLFCLIATYVVLNFRRTSGIFSDPSSIASVGSLLGNQDFVRELRDIPVNASTKDIRRLLVGSKYKLATFPTDGGNFAYGIVKAPSDRRGNDGYHITNLQETTSTKPKTLSNSSGFLHDILLLALSVGILAVVLAYYRDHKDDGFNKFFNSTGFGPRFILSVAATTLDNRWKHLEKEVRMMQPYRELYKRKGIKVSTDSLLAHTASTTYTSFPIALWRRNFFVALVSFIAILSDVLIIAVVGVPFGYGQLYSSFSVSTWISVTEQLALLSMEAQETRDRVVRGWSDGYWFGQGLGLDQKTRWLIDRGDERYESSKKARVGQRYF